MPLNLNGVIEGPPTPLDGNAIFSKSIRLWMRQRDALINDRWEALEGLANQGVGDANSAYGEMMGSLGVIDALVKEATDNLAIFLKFHASQKDTRKEFFAEMKRQLISISPNTSSKRLKALDELGKGKLAHNLILEGLKDREPEDPEMVDRAISSTVALAVRSVMSLGYTSFNQRMETLATYPFETHKDELVGYFEDVVDQFNDAMEARLKRLHGDLAKKRAPQSAAEQLASDIQEKLPAFARALAGLNLYTAALRKTNTSADVLEKLGKLSAAAGAMFRSGFAYHAAANYLSLQSKAVKKDPQAESLLHPVGKRPYESAFPNGKDTKLTQVKNVASGSYIEIGGFVVGVTSRRDSDGKLLSKVTLTNPAGNEEVDAVGIFVNLRNVGLQEGAYCTLSGTWRKNSTINSGNAAVEIEKLRINQLAKKSWKIQFTDLADRFVDRWPSGLNIAFGLSQHFSGGPEGDSKKLGAGELIFKPFYREAPES